MPAIHEAANLFPLDEETIGELADDIRQRGQMVPIELLDGKVLDGRRRLLACEQAGVEPTFKTVDVADPVAYVLSLNLHRRHLNTSQRSMIGARAKAMYDKAAKERQRASGGDRKSGKSVPVKRPEPIRGESRDLAGAALNVSGASISRAERVLENGSPEVVKAVDEGRMTVGFAAALVKESPEVQKQIAEDIATRKRSPMQMDKATSRLPVGVVRSHEAINILSRIPKDDAQRSEGFKLVADWLSRQR